MPAPDPAERLSQVLDAMVSIGSGPGPDLHTTLSHIVQTAARVVDCRYAALGVLADDADGADERGLKEFVTAGMSPEQIARIDRFPDGTHGLLAAVLRADEPLRLPDLTLDARFEGFPARHPPMHSFLGIPVRVGGELFGNLYLTEKRTAPGFTDEDVRVIRILATEAGIAIGNARLREAARIRERWIDGSAAVTTALLAGDPGNALDVVAEQARRLAGAAAGLVLLPTRLPGDPGGPGGAGGPGG
ncbi:GAF domain-containing protein, partial [Streptomyces boncukensis]